MTNSRIILIGAGGHAKVCLELLKQSGYEVECCIGTDKDNDFCAGVPVIKDEGALMQFRAQGYQNAFVALGDNRLRRKYLELLLELGYSLVNAISSHAVICNTARLGNGIAIMPGAIVNADSKIGDGVIINTNATVDHDCEIGAYSHIAPHVGLAGVVRVGQSAFLGIGSKVIPGIKIGDNAIVGAGSVVIRDIPANQKVVGIPARLITN